MLVEAYFVWFDPHRLGTGWSFHTNGQKTYKKDSGALSREETDIIQSVIARAERLDTGEQERIGWVIYSSHMHVMQEVVGSIPGIYDVCSVCNVNNTQVILELAPDCTWKNVMLYVTYRCVLCNNFLPKLSQSETFLHDALDYLWWRQELQIGRD